MFDVPPRGAHRPVPGAKLLGFVVEYAERGTHNVHPDAERMVISLLSAIFE